MHFEIVGEIADIETICVGSGIHQNEMWEYMDMPEDDGTLSFDESDKEEHTQEWMDNMKMQVRQVSVSESGGEYFQALFEEGDPGSEQDSPDGKYFLIQRQFETPDGGLIYVENDDLDPIGHFKVIKASLNPKCFSLTLRGKRSASIELTFEATPKNYGEVKRILRIMIPSIELSGEA